MTYSDHIFRSGSASRSQLDRSFYNLGTRLIPLVGVAALGGAAPALAAPPTTGTVINVRHDFRAVAAGTNLKHVVFEGEFTPVVRGTRMARLRGLAPSLTVGDWAHIFDVSRQTVNTWSTVEPKGRDELDSVEASLGEAAKFHPDLGKWLKSPVPGMSISPIDLLRAKRWRAFSGAVRAKVATPVALTPKQLMERRRAEVSWPAPAFEPGKREVE